MICCHDITCCGLFENSYTISQSLHGHDVRAVKAVAKVGECLHAYALRVHDIAQGISKRDNIKNATSACRRQPDF